MHIKWQLHLFMFWLKINQSMINVSSNMLCWWNWILCQSIIHSMKKMNSVISRMSYFWNLITNVFIRLLCNFWLKRQSFLILTHIKCWMFKIIWFPFNVSSSVLKQLNYLIEHHLIKAEHALSNKYFKNRPRSRHFWIMCSFFLKYLF